MEKIKGAGFHPKADFTVARDFKLNGKSYTHGDVFDYRQVACSVRRLRQLFENRFLSIGDVPEPGPVETPAEPDAPELVYDPDVHEIENPERGVWIMTEDGETVCTLTPKAAKRLRGLANPVAVNQEDILED